MDYFLTEEQAMIRDLARQIAEEKIVPVRAELDETGEFPWDIMKVLAQSDLFVSSSRRIRRSRQGMHGTLASRRRALPRLRRRFRPPMRQTRSAPSPCSSSARTARRRSSFLT